MWIIVFAKCWWRSFFCKLLFRMIYLQLLVWDNFFTNWHQGSFVGNFCLGHFLQIAEVDHYFLKIVIGNRFLQLFPIIFSQRGWEPPLYKLLLGIIFPNCPWGSLFAIWCHWSICLQIFVEDPYLCEVLLWIHSFQFFIVKLFWKLVEWSFCNIPMEIITNTNTNTRGSNLSKLLLMVGIVSVKLSLRSSLENFEAVAFDYVKVNISDPWHPEYTGFTEILNINAK